MGDLVALERLVGARGESYEEFCGLFSTIGVGDAGAQVLPVVAAEPAAAHGGLGEGLSTEFLQLLRGVAREMAAAEEAEVGADDSDDEAPPAAAPVADDESDDEIPLENEVRGGFMNASAGAGVSVGVRTKIDNFVEAEDEEEEDDDDDKDTNAAAGDADAAADDDGIEFDDDDLSTEDGEWIDVNPADARPSNVAAGPPPPEAIEEARREAEERAAARARAREIQDQEAEYIVPLPPRRDDPPHQIQTDADLLDVAMLQKTGARVEIIDDDVAVAVEQTVEAGTRARIEIIDEDDNGGTPTRPAKAEKPAESPDTTFEPVEAFELDPDFDYDNIELTKPEWPYNMRQTYTM